MTDGVIQPGGGSVIFEHPTLEGISCEVQHNVQSGKPHTSESGLIGVGVVTLPTGQPRLILQVKHPDGTSLGGVLNAGDATTIMECIADAMIEAQAIADRADQAVRQ
jgi:hypothetical protein